MGKKSTKIDSVATVKEYIDKADWRINANANTDYSHPGAVNNFAGKVIANFWLDGVYTDEEGEAHRTGDYHIHDLDILAPYCCGHDLQKLLDEGFNGVAGRVGSKPPKHLREALYQMANYLGILQAEWAGAQAFSSFDTYLAPYVFFDMAYGGLTYADVKKSMRNFVYNLNVPSRWGQSPFTNVTIDWRVPNFMKDMLPTRGGDNYFQSIKTEWEERAKKSDKEFNAEKWDRLLDAAIERYEEVTGEKYDGEKDDILLYMTYTFFQKEMDILNKSFYEVLNEGDTLQMPFTFPIPTINITEDFDWYGPNTDILFENTAKYGSSYFQNFIGSQYKKDENGELVRDPDAYSPNDVRSMCCRLQLDKKQLRKRGGGLFGSDSQTGCYDDKTEVLTDSGWKKFEDLTMKDALYTLNEDGEIELHEPDTIFAYEYDGDMIHYKSKSLDLLVTPNHRMLGVRRKSGKQYFVHAEDCKRITIPTTGEWKEERNGVADSVDHYIWLGDKKVPMAKWLLFLGIYISEGYSYANTEKYVYKVVIKQKHPEKTALVRMALKQLPIHFSEKRDKNNITIFTITNKELALTLAELGKSSEKHIPNYVFLCNKSELYQLYRGLMLGDGSYTPAHGKTSYYTCSDRLKDDFERLLLLIGMHGDASWTQRDHSGWWQITVRKRKIKSISKENVSKVHYKGKVYCAQVENHTLFVRRNNKSCWCGNSIGVVTMNMARLGYLYKGDMPALLNKLDTLMDMAKSTLEKKRVFVTDLMERGFYPFTRRYIRSLDTFFSTIGVNGMNEMVRNFTGDEYDITDERGQKMCCDILDHIRERLVTYQEETGNLYNLEATPAEGTMRRFSHLDKKMFPDIIQAGNNQTPYYTNSSQLPVDFTADAFTALDLQDDLQKKYTGGCVERGSLVLTNRGRMAIEDIVYNFDMLNSYGDEPLSVFSYNPETNEEELDPIVEAMEVDVSRKDKIRVVFNGWDIVTSDWHPFFVLREANPETQTIKTELVRADALKVGDKVIGVNNVGMMEEGGDGLGDLYEVMATEKATVEDNTFFDLTTQKNHNYLCGKGENKEVYVHNTVLHIYMRERVSSPDACRRLVKAILTNYRLPYISITPTFSICPIHGRIEGEQEFCPYCDQEIINSHAQEVDTNL